MHTQEEPHSSIQVVPITRPSLRGGRTAYAVISREPSSFWPPSPRGLDDAVCPVGLARISEGLDRSNDGQDHTVLPYAHSLAPQGSMASCTLPSKCWRDELNSAARPHAATGSQGLPALPAPFMPTLPRPPQARLAKMTTTRSPLLDEPGWATHTTNPNFGKVEYFCDDGLTTARHRRACVNPDQVP